MRVGRVKGVRDEKSEKGLRGQGSRVELSQLSSSFARFFSGSRDLGFGFRVSGFGPQVSGLGSFRS